MIEKRGSRYYIQEDIIFKILLLLPAKSLLRFNTVCKVWQSIISNPQFIYTHVANSQKKQARVAFLRNEEDPFNMDISSHEEFITLTVPPQCSDLTHHTISYNGLLCLINIGRLSICVWNPLTKQLKIIPTEKKKYLQRRSCRIGFGFDSSSNDYKILWMVKISDVLEAELYSFNDDSWKEIRVPKTVRPSIIGWHSKCVQLETGVLYMNGFSELVSFDLQNEVFAVYWYPWNFKRIKSHVLKFEDSVAMVFKTFGGEVSLWTLDSSCGGKMSWIKRFNIEADRKIKRVFFNFGIGQILSAGKDDGYFFYDYKTKATKNVGKDIEINSAVTYTESLVSLKGFLKTTNKW